MDESELQNEETWDFARAEKRAGVKKARAVVSVAFPRTEFERVTQAAKEAGERTSEFIRQATLEKTRRQRLTSPTPLSVSSSHGASLFTPTYLPETRVSGPSAEVERHAVTA